MEHTVVLLCNHHVNPKLYSSCRPSFRSFHSLQSGRSHFFQRIQFCILYVYIDPRLKKNFWFKRVLYVIQTHLVHVYQATGSFFLISSRFKFPFIFFSKIIPIYFTFSTIRISTNHQKLNLLHQQFCICL